MITIAKWFRKLKRNTDIKILWPACVQNSTTKNEAVLAFLYHVLIDSAWNKDFSKEEIYEFIKTLPYEK